MIDFDNSLWKFWRFLRLQNTKIFYEYLVKTQGHRNEKLGQKGWSYSAAKFTSWNKIVSPLEWQFGYSRLTLAINYWHFKTFLRLQNTKRQMGSTWSVSVIGALEHTLHNLPNTMDFWRNGRNTPNWQFPFKSYCDHQRMFLHGRSRGGMVVTQWSCLVIFHQINAFLNF